jgi:hypothetical protein
MHVKWSDYLSTALVRAVSGLLLGAALSVAVSFFAGVRARHNHEARASLLVDLVQKEKYGTLMLWFGGWGIVGAAIAVATIPRWQTPWYKSILESDDKHDDE